MNWDLFKVRQQIHTNTYTLTYAKTNSVFTSCLQKMYVMCRLCYKLDDGKDSNEKFYFTSCLSAKQNNSLKNTKNGHLIWGKIYQNWEIIKKISLDSYNSIDLCDLSVWSFNYQIIFSLWMLIVIKKNNVTCVIEIVSPLFCLNRPPKNLNKKWLTSTSLLESSGK